MRRLTSYIVDPGLDAYGARMGAALRKRVYEPYLRELQALERQADVRDFYLLERQAIPTYGRLMPARTSRRKRSVKSWLRNTLLLIVGSASISICLLPRTGVVA